MNPTSTPSLAALEAQGASFVRTTSSSTSTTSVGGIPVSSKTTYTCTHAWTLPRDTGIQASFAKEGFTKKIVKLFKKELQVGDPDFDALVYISTDTRDATATLLSSAEVRAAVSAILQIGGDVTIDGAEVTLRAPVGEDPHGEPDPGVEATLLTHLLTPAA